MYSSIESSNNKGHIDADPVEREEPPIMPVVEQAA